MRSATASQRQVPRVLDMLIRNYEQRSVCSFCNAVRQELYIMACMHAGGVKASTALPAAAHLDAVCGHRSHVCASGMVDSEESAIGG